ncbi:MAG: hypothetical protein WCE64_15780 [Bacteroidales bacterium]
MAGSIIPFNYRRASADGRPEYYLVNYFKPILNPFPKTFPYFD